MLLRDDGVTIRHHCHEAVDKGDVQLPPIELEILDMITEHDSSSHTASLTDVVMAIEFH